MINKIDIKEVVLYVSLCKVPQAAPKANITPIT
jgi:hypothetical protein